MPRGRIRSSAKSQESMTASMTANFQQAGAYTALITPFHLDGRLDLERFRALVAFQLKEGIDGLVPCGTTGETPTLEWEEHDKLIEIAVELAAGARPVVAGCGSNSTEEAIDATRRAKELGVDAALLVDCYYNGPSSLELREEYYQRILDAVSELPIVPYVIPGRTGCALEAADLAILHLRAPERVPAVKEATGDLERMREDRAVAGETLQIVSGDDDMTLRMMRDEGIRASGVISVMSNLFPGAISRMLELERAGDSSGADALSESLKPVFGLVGCAIESERVLPNGKRVKSVDRFRNPLPVKTMMAGLRMCELGLRPPLGKMLAPAVERCREALIEVNRRDSSLLAPIAEHFEGGTVEERLADDARWASLARA